MKLGEHDLEALISLLETGELEEELASEIQEQLEKDDSARKLWASFQRMSQICGVEIEEEPTLPDVDADRILESLHARMEREGLGDPLRSTEAAQVESPEVEILPEVLTVAEVARYLRVTREELEGELEGLPFFEFAGRMRMRRESLMRWLEEREAWSRRQRMFSLPHTGEAL